MVRKNDAKPSERPVDSAHESREGFYVDADGKKADAAFHAPILNNRTADRLIQRRAVQDAIERGLSLDEALRLYGNSLELGDLADLRVSPEAMAPGRTDRSEDS